MSLSQGHSTITFGEYSQLGEGVQYEVMDGKVYYISSHSVKHQLVETELLTEFNVYLRTKPYRALTETTICLSGEEDPSKANEWVKPDMMICDNDHIHENGIVGTPDLIVEILSESTDEVDKVVKLHRYERAGVKEYWIVDPVHETVDVYVLKNEQYTHKRTYEKNEVIQVNLFKDLFIDLKRIFRDSF